MRACLGASAALLCLVSCDVAPVEGPSGGDAPTTFAVVEDWPKLPEGRSFGRVLGVAVAPDGRVWVSHTADGAARNDVPIPGPTLAVLDPSTGELLAELGGGQFRLPHALTFDDAGNLWVTDADAGRLVLIDPGGQVLGTIGAE